MRYQSSAEHLSDYEVTEDIKTSRFTFKKGDKISFMLEQGLHHNPSQWIRPHEYIPERFDPDDPLYLTPGGIKRNPFSYMPFGEGRRRCLGMNLGYINMHIFLTYFINLFDVEWTDPDRFAWN